MYRATAEAVSGTRVYADGKWLRCIGNKRVSVGDRIWTDGRCVYGHFQESQQPQVITAAPVEDEGIPIVRQISGKNLRLMTFQKNKLKDVAEVRYEEGKLNLYNYVAGEYVFARELDLEADKWTNWSLMINDYRKTAFLYDEATHLKSNFYGVEKSFFTDTELIACNIDKAGNRFDMVIHYESDTTSEDKRIITNKFVQILKNGEVVKSISIQQLIDDTEAACPDPDRLFEIKGTIDPEKASYTAIIGDDFNLIGSSNRSNFGFSLFNEYPNAFIEDEKTWGFWFTSYCNKTNTLNAKLWDLLEDDSGGIYIFPGLSQAILYRHYHVTAKGAAIVCEGITKGYYNANSVTISYHTPVDYTEDNLSRAERITIPLQDGYRCEAYDLFDWSDVYGEGSAVDADEPQFAFMTLYTPDNKEILTGVFPLYVHFLICKIKGGHILYVSHSAKGVLRPDFDSYKDVQAIEQGFHIIRNEQRTHISDTSTINQRLRPMKKISRWQNRLKLIEIEQHEI